MKLFRCRLSMCEGDGMEEWKEVRLEECVSLLGDGLHGTPKYTENGEYAFINGNNLINGKIVIKPETKRVNEDEYLKYKKNLTDRTIFVSINGTIGNVGTYNGEKIILGKSACYFNVLDDIDKTFIKYVVSSPLFKTYLETNATGTTIKNVSLAQMRNYSFLIPPLPTQQKIAAILSSLDDKIELNNKINTNLERQAGALFKNWFVDFEPFGGKMPEGWKVGKLSDIAEITMGQSPDGKSYNEDGIGTVFYQGRAEFGTRFPTRRLFTTEPKRIAKKFDTLMSVRAPVGDTNIANEDCCIGRGLAAIHAKDNHQSFVHYTVVSLRPQLDVFNGEGTVFGCINRDALNNMEVIIPSKIDLDKFEKIVTTMDIDIFNRSEENDRLKNIRDTLLPKLMNGEICIDIKKIGGKNGFI